LQREQGRGKTAIAVKRGKTITSDKQRWAVQFYTRDRGYIPEGRAEAAEPKVKLLNMGTKESRARNVKFEHSREKPGNPVTRLNGARMH